MYEFGALERFHKDLKRGFHPRTTEKINRSEMDLLVTLSKIPNMPFRFYGRHIHLEKSSFSYVVDLLVLKGLVVKKADEEDKRKKTLELTDNGKKTVEELKTQYKEHLNRRMSIFSEDEQKEIRSSLEVIKKYGKKLHDSVEEDHQRKKHGMMYHGLNRKEMKSDRMMHKNLKRRMDEDC